MAAIVGGYQECLGALSLCPNLATPTTLIPGHAMYKFKQNVDKFKGSKHWIKTKNPYCTDNLKSILSSYSDGYGSSFLLSHDGYSLVLYNSYYPNYTLRWNGSDWITEGNRPYDTRYLWSDGTRIYNYTVIQTHPNYIIDPVYFNTSTMVWTPTTFNSNTVPFGGTSSPNCLSESNNICFVLNNIVYTTFFRWSTSTSGNTFLYSFDATTQTILAQVSTESIYSSASYGYCSFIDKNGLIHIFNSRDDVSISFDGSTLSKTTDNIGKIAKNIWSDGEDIFQGLTLEFDVDSGTFVNTDKFTIDDDADTSAPIWTDGDEVYLGYIHDEYLYKLSNTPPPPPSINISTLSYNTRTPIKNILTKDLNEQLNLLCDKFNIDYSSIEIKNNDRNTRNNLVNSINKSFNTLYESTGLTYSIINNSRISNTSLINSVNKRLKKLGE